MKYLALAGFIATIPAANWMIGHVGMCMPNGPCLVPVAPGLMAPSGVLLVGAAMVLRDYVQERLGLHWSLAAVLVGALLSWLVAPPMLALASAVAFLLSELLDTAVYTPLRRRHLMLAVVASGLVGAAADSAAFLLLAFGSLDFLAGQVVGKLWALLFALPVIRLARTA